MSTPQDQQQLQPPPMVATAQVYTNKTGHGSVGAVIAAVAVITILGVIAGMIGRLCTGRRVLGHGHYYDFESWMESKCSSCIDGHIDPHPPTLPVNIQVAADVEEHHVQEQEQAQEAAKEEEEEQHRHKHHVGSSES